MKPIWIKIFAVNCIALLYLTTEVQSGCPNACSGHGSCSSSNKCTCDSGWDVVADCSLKSCPKGIAWFDKASAPNTGHASAECSNRGLCNYAIGVCNCFTGFTGDSCQRAKCANDCSERGKCLSLGAIALYYGPDTVPGTGGDGVGVTYTNWEKDNMFMCFCDNGYTGPDCSMIMCPKNDDPYTTGQSYRTITITTGSSGTALTGSFYISFNGERFTLPADVDTNTDSTCAAAVMTLPNVKTATCTISSVDATTKGAVYTIAFQAWTGIQAENNVFFHDGNPDISSFTCDMSAITSANGPTCSIADSISSNVLEHVYCSGRGVCNFLKGVCTCSTDYKGHDCNILSNVPDNIEDNDGFLISLTAETYVGKALHIKTTKAAASDFYMMYVQANSVPVFSMNGLGHTYWHIGNVFISAGSLTVYAGITVTTVGLTVVDGGASISNSHTSTEAVNILSTSTALTGTVLKARTATVSADSFYLFEAQTSSTTTLFSIRGDGLTTLSTGGLTVVDGATSMTHSQDAVSPLTVTASGGAFATSILKLQTSNTVASSTFNFIEALASTVSLFKVDGNGKTTTLGGLSVTGATDLTNSDQVAPALTVHSSHPTFLNTVQLLQTTATAAGTFKFLDLQAGGGGSVFSVLGSGLTTVESGGLVVSSGGATVSAGGLSVSGGATINTGGLVVTAGGCTISADGLNVVNGGASISNLADGNVILLTSTQAALANDVVKIVASSTNEANFNLISAYVGTTSLKFVVAGTGSLTAVGSITTQDTTPSTSTTTGSLIAGGGLGVAGAAFVGGALKVSDTTPSTSTTTGSIIAGGGIGAAGAGYFGGVLSTTDITDASSSTTGSIITAGGIGVAKKAYFAGAVNVEDLTESTSITTGSIITAGGVGIAGNLYLGGTMALISTAQSTSTTTGALILSGGLGVALDATIGGSITTTEVTETSDRRLKRNIRSLSQSTDSISVIQQLSPVTFMWKNATKHRVFGEVAGFIAQEVEEVLPNLVRTDRDGWKSIHYSGVIPYAVDVIKKQQDRIQHLEQKVKQLENTFEAKLDALLRRIEQLDSVLMTPTK